MVAPLNQLLSASKPWKWTEVEEHAFQESKQLLLTSDILVHYDPKLELVLSCDASSYGVGAVLSHCMPDGTERPVGFASQTLTSAAMKYSQIEKEGLACVFGVKRFHNYLYGRPFTLCTDHKLLISLFDEQKAISAQVSGCIQRCSLTLAAHQYNIVFKYTLQHGNADAVSRLPLYTSHGETPIPAETILLMEHLNRPPLSALQVREWTRPDKTLCWYKCCDWCRMVGQSRVMRRNFSHLLPKVPGFW